MSDRLSPIATRLSTIFWKKIHAFWNFLRNGRGMGVLELLSSIACQLSSNLPQGEFFDSLSADLEPESSEMVGGLSTIESELSTIL